MEWAQTARSSPRQACPSAVNEELTDIAQGAIRFGASFNYNKVISSIKKYSKGETE